MCHIVPQYPLESYSRILPKAVACGDCDFRGASTVLGWCCEMTSTSPSSIYSISRPEGAHVSHFDLLIKLIALIILHMKLLHFPQKIRVKIPYIGELLWRISVAAADINARAVSEWHPASWSFLPAEQQTGFSPSKCPSHDAAFGKLNLVISTVLPCQYATKHSQLGCHTKWLESCVSPGQPCRHSS